MAYRKTTLPGGIRLVTEPVPDASSVAILVGVGVGSRYETESIRGLAHFTEHMFFKGAERYRTAFDISAALDGVGGVINAGTGKERTVFYVKCASEHLPTAVAVLSDMLLDSRFDSAEINRERGVIIAERNMYLDTPRDYIEEVYQQLLYGDHPLGWDTIGVEETISGVSREDFLSYRDSWYRAGNVVVGIAGGFDPCRAAELVSSGLGRIRTGKVGKCPPATWSQTQPAVRLSFKETDQAHLCLGARTFERTHPDRYILRVLNAILGEGMSSRLFIEIRERRGLAYYVHSSVDPFLDCGSLVVRVGVDLGQVNEAIKVVLEQFGRLRRESVEAEELNKAKELIKGRRTLALEDSAALAEFLVGQELLEGEILSREEVSARIDAVTAADVQRLAEAIFRNEGLNLAIIGPYSNEGDFTEILRL